MNRVFDSKNIERGSDSYLYWKQDVLLERFEGVEDDFALIAKDLFEAAREYPTEFRRGYLAAVSDVLSGVDQSLRDRFSELVHAREIRSQKEKEFWK